MIWPGTPNYTCRMSSREEKQPRPNSLDASLRPGTEVGGYVVQSVLGSGGMGTVYAARQTALDRPVALKVIAPWLATDPEFRSRFVQESRVAAALDHPNVVTIYEAGEDGGLLFVSMRAVEGRDLKRLVEHEGPLAPDRAVAIVSQVASALDAAHTAGVVHRDVKPANVLVEQRGGYDHAYLSDFGLVKRSGADESLTGSGGWLGSVDYLAPEQVQGGVVDARSDIYALGALLFFTLTGQVMFPRPDVAAKLYASVNDRMPSLLDFRTDVPSALEAVIRQATAKKPTARYPTAGAMAQAARAALAGQAAGTARPLPAKPGAALSGALALAASGRLGATASRLLKPATPIGRRRLFAIGTAALAAVIALIVTALAGVWSSPQTPSQSAQSPGGASNQGASPQNAKPVPVHGAPNTFSFQGVPLTGQTYDVTDNSGEHSAPPSLALAGETAFAVPDMVAQSPSLQVINAASGKMIGTVPPAVAVDSTANQAETPPIVATFAGKQFAVVGYVLTVHRKGATHSSKVLEIDAVDTHAHRLWKIVKPLPRGTAAFISLFLGPKTVVVNLGDNHEIPIPHPVLAFNLETRKLAWQNSTFEPLVVANDIVVGERDDQYGPHSGETVALNMQTGAQLWGRIDAPKIDSGIQASATNVLAAADTDNLQLLNVKNGKWKSLPNLTGAIGSDDLSSCAYDQQAVIVCSFTGDSDLDSEYNYTLGVDGKTGAVIWQLTGDAMLEPITAAYDGKVYGKTASGPVVVNARTGKTLNPTVGIEPYVVDTDVAIAADPSAPDPVNARLMAYPVTR